MRVYISPSSQEHNITALKDTEENVMHRIADELMPLLKESGIEVFRGKKEQTLAQMVNESNSLAVDAHIAIHSNAMGGSESGKARGCEIFHYPSSNKGKVLATSIYKYLEPLTPTADRGIKTSSTLYELKSTHFPAVIVETAFHDNFDDATWIVNNIAPIAEALAKGICDYLGTPFNKNPYMKAIEQIKAILEDL